MKYPEYRMYMEAALPSPVHSWLRQELELRGIDSLVYTRYIISLMQQEPEQLDMFDREVDMLCKPSLDPKKKGRRKCSISEEQKKKSAAIECLSAVTDEKTSIVHLVEELCSRLKDNNDTVEEGLSPHPSTQTEVLPETQPQTYYEAFPSLQGRKIPESPSSKVSMSTVWSKTVVVSPADQTSQDQTGSQTAGHGEESSSPAAEEVKKINIQINTRRKHRGRQHPPKDNHEHSRHSHGRSKSAGKNRNSSRSTEGSQQKAACQKYPPGFQQNLPVFQPGMCEEEVWKIIAAYGYCPNWSPTEADSLEIELWSNPHNEHCYQAESQIKGFIFQHGGEKDYKELEDVHEPPEELRERIEKIHIAPEHDSVSPELKESDSWYSMPVPSIKANRNRLFDRSSESNSPVDQGAISESQADLSNSSHLFDHSSESSSPVEPDVTSEPQADRSLSPGDGRPRSHSAPTEDIWHLWQDTDLLSSCIDGSRFEDQPVATQPESSPTSFLCFGVVPVRDARAYGFEAAITSPVTPTWLDNGEDDPTPTPDESIVKPNASEDCAVFHTDRQIVSVVLPQPLDAAGWQLPPIGSPQYVQSDDFVRQNPFSGLVWSQPPCLNTSRFSECAPEPDVLAAQPANNIRQCMHLFRAREGQNNKWCSHPKALEGECLQMTDSTHSGDEGQSDSANTTEVSASTDNFEATPEWNVDDFDELDASQTSSMIQSQQIMFEGLVNMMADDNIGQSTELLGTTISASDECNLHEDGKALLCAAGAGNISIAIRNPRNQSIEVMQRAVTGELDFANEIQSQGARAKDIVPSIDKQFEDLDPPYSTGYCTSQLWDVNLQKVARNYGWDYTGDYSEYVEDKLGYTSLDKLMSDMNTAGNGQVDQTDNTLIPEISIDLSTSYDDADDSNEVLHNSWLPNFNRSVSLGDVPGHWDGFTLNKVPNPRLSKSFELIPSECSAFNDVPKGLFHVYSEPDLGKLRQESSYVNARRPTTPQNEIHINPHTHFRPITPAYAPELSSPRARKESLVHDLFGGVPSTKTPYQRYQTVKDESEDEGFIVRFKLKNTCKGVQTGDSIDEPESSGEEDDNYRDTPEALTRGMINELIEEKDDEETPAESDSGLGLCTNSQPREYQLFENHAINSVQACYPYMQDWPSASLSFDLSTSGNCDCQKEQTFWSSSDIEGTPKECIHTNESDASAANNWDYSSSWKETVDIDHKFGDGEPDKYRGIWSSGECAYPGEFMLKYSSGEEDSGQEMLPDALLVHLDDSDNGALFEDLEYLQNFQFDELEEIGVSVDKEDAGKNMESCQPVGTDDGYEVDDGYMKVKIVYKQPLKSQQSTNVQQLSKHTHDDLSDWAPIPDDAKLSSELEEEWMNPDVQATVWLSGRYPGSQIKPCSFYLEGNCWRDADCKFSHDLSNITCKHWEIGVCFKGPLCPFRHAYDSQYRSGTGSKPGTPVESSSSELKLSQSFTLEKEDFPELSLSVKSANKFPMKDQPLKAMNMSHSSRREKTRKNYRRHSNKENEEKLRNVSQCSSSV